MSGKSGSFVVSPFLTPVVLMIKFDSMDSGEGVLFQFTVTGRGEGLFQFVVFEDLV